MEKMKREFLKVGSCQEAVGRKKLRLNAVVSVKVPSSDSVRPQERALNKFGTAAGTCSLCIRYDSVKVPASGCACAGMTEKGLVRRTHSGRTVLRNAVFRANVPPCHVLRVTRFDPLLRPPVFLLETLLSVL